MSDNMVSVDSSVSPAEISFSDVFNVAVPFIDRHLDEGRGEKIAIRVHGGGDVSYATLAEHVNRAGNALSDLGINKGDRVLMMVKDGAEFFYIFWGAIKAGILPVPLNTLLRAKDYAFMIENSEASGVIYSPEFAAEVEPAVEQSPHKPKITLLTEGEGETIAKHMASASPDLAPVPAKAEDDCFWLYSSGTTGSPKGVVHAHKDMVVTSQQYAVGVLGITEDDICFSAAKLFFAYGLGNAMTFPLWVGAQAIFYPGPPSPDACHEVIEKFNPTIFYGVPTLYAAQLKSMENSEPDLSSVRVCTSAGEALPPDLLKRWTDKTGIPMLDGIGTTEILHIFLSNQIGKVKPGASGLVVPGYEGKIVDEEGQEVPTGETGALMIKGNSLLKLYWRNPEKTAEALRDGWMYTGDTYYVDEDGFFFCCGRSDDMLKVGGIWCSPVEIENKLVEHPKVLEAAIVGREDDEQLTKPEAFIVLNDAGDAGEELEAELLEHCKSGLARYKYPRWFNFVDDLPKTATGKIQRFKLRSN
ncbi:MAG: benzoate-CoA ligase family protein [Rhodospirillales bacterium]|jgi:benzoate-CoA ligase family protein